MAHTARNKAEYTQHRGDRARVLAAVEQAGWALRHATQDLRGDRKVVLRAVRQSGWALADASLELRADPSVVREAASQSGLAMLSGPSALGELFRDVDCITMTTALKKKNSLLKVLVGASFSILLVLPS